MVNVAIAFYFFFKTNVSSKFLLGIQKYQNNPTSTGLDTKDYPISNIDFPGITICPNTKVWITE